MIWGAKLGAPSLKLGAMCSVSMTVMYLGAKAWRPLIEALCRAGPSYPLAPFGRQAWRPLIEALLDRDIQFGAGYLGAKLGAPSLKRQVAVSGAGSHIIWAPSLAPPH